MHHYQMYSQHRRERGSYFLPFLCLLMVGLIVVLLFQIVDYFQAKHLQKIENKAAVKIAVGRAEMKLWGVDTWTQVVDGSILSTGDSVKTGPGSRVVLSLLNGSVLRLDSESEVEIVDLKTRDGQDNASFKIKKGQMWMKKSPNEVVRTTFTVETTHLSVSSIGTIFNVAFFEKESVHVLDGNVRLQVKVEDENNARGALRVAEELEVELGQEVAVGPNELLNLRNRTPFELLALLSDEFRDSDWFKWNRQQDASGTAVLSVTEAAAQKKQPQIEPAPKPLKATEITATEISVSLPVPIIESPVPPEFIMTSDTVVISGSTAEHTQKMEVTTYHSGKAEIYILQKYTPGSVKWSYVASPQYRNITSGKNYFEIVAIGKDGNRSPAAKLTVIYDRSFEPGDLSAPVVISFDAGPPAAVTTQGVIFETRKEEVIVVGKIGKGITKLVINDFVLTRFVPGSTNWSYYGKVSYGNLKDGENVYRVYGIDALGNKTQETVFKIIKKTPPLPSALAPMKEQEPDTPTPAKSQNQPSAAQDVPL